MMDREATDNGTVQHWVNHLRRPCQRRGTLWRKPRDRRTRKCRCCRNCCQSDGPEIRAVISVSRVVLLPYISTPTTDCVCGLIHRNPVLFFQKAVCFFSSAPSSCYEAGNLEKNDNDSYWWARKEVKILRRVGPK